MEERKVFRLFGVANRVLKSLSNTAAVGREKQGLPMKKRVKEKHRRCCSSSRFGFEISARRVVSIEIQSTVEEEEEEEEGKED